MLSGKKAPFATAGFMQHTDNLPFLKDLIESGSMKSVIARRYSLENIAAAYRYVEQRHKKGNVVITVAYARSHQIATPNRHSAQKWPCAPKNKLVTDARVLTPSGQGRGRKYSGTCYAPMATQSDEN